MLKEEILQVISENFMEMMLDTGNQNIQETLKKFQDTKIKEYEKTQKQTNELIGAHNQTLKQQKQLSDRNNHIPVNINPECQWTQLTNQKTPLDKLDLKRRSNNLLFIGDPSH
jgi:hypothetical protein